MDAVIPLAVKSLEGNHLAPRGCLVRVRCGTDQNSPTERWFSVGSYPQRSAEVAVRNLPQIESTNAVFARRPLKRAEIEMLKLRRAVSATTPFNLSLPWQSLNNPSFRRILGVEEANRSLFAN